MNIKGHFVWLEKFFIRQINRLPIKLLIFGCSQSRCNSYLHGFSINHNQLFLEKFMNVRS